MTREISPVVATIKSGQTTSTVVYLGNATAAGIVFPAAMEGTKLTIQASHHPSSFFVPLVSAFDGSPLEADYQLGKAVDLVLSGNVVFAFPFFRFVADATQAADRTLIVVGKG